MKRPIAIMALLGLLLVLATVGAVLAQDSETLQGTSFQIEAEIGRAVPNRLIYDPNFERYAVADAYGRLLLVDAQTYETQHILYNGGDYNDLLFSNDGRWLALAIGTRIELWDANSGERVAFLDDLSQALRVHGPLAFARDDNLLVFSGTYPAPQALRRSENDTTTVPWLWNLTSARNEGDSTFPRRVEALPFFDYRNGFTLGPNDQIVTALPGRLHVLDAYTTELRFEIPTNRFEQDPLTVWFSERDDQIYVLTTDGNTLLQVDTEQGLLVEIPISQNLTPTDLENIGPLELSSSARVIGSPAHRSPVPLIEVFLGEDYNERCTTNENGARRCRFLPYTVTLIDVLNVPFGSESRLSALMFVFNEESELGFFTLSRARVQQMTVSAANDRVLVRFNSGDDERIRSYDLDTGERDWSIIPILRTPNRFNPDLRNRVLRYTPDNNQIISDFERLDATNGQSLQSDTRYARRFDRFFFTDDGNRVVTLSGTEWRLWDINTSELVERKVINLTGNIVATSPDGFRYLTRFNTGGSSQPVGMEIYDAADDSRQQVRFDALPGHSIQDIYHSPDWESFMVVYSVNGFGPYAPSNQVAGYGMADGWRWLIAGDDLPFANNRRYGWVNNETAYIYGSGNVGETPARIFGVEYAPNGLPTCIIERISSADPEPVRRRWWSETYFLNVEEANRLAGLVCDSIDANNNFNPRIIRELARSELNPTQTPVIFDDVPACLTQRYPALAEQYAADWRALTEGLSDAEKREVAAIFCDAYDEDRIGSVTQSGELTMMIDGQTGERASGNFTPPGNTRPVGPIIAEFERTERRSPGTVLLSPDEARIAVSNLPGELIIYRVVVGYQNLLAQRTATAVTRFEEQQLVGALPTYTPTFAPIGTAQPTLTPTPRLTQMPLPDTNPASMPRLGDVEQICPSQTLFTLDAPPEGYNATGRIIAPAGGEVLWVAEPETGERYPDADIPPCGFTLDCELSPDNAWILARGLQGISVRRPDESDFRLLFDFEESDYVPNDVYWAGVDTIEYEIFIPRREGETRTYRHLQRDILGVFPDPEPWYPFEGIDGIAVSIGDRQPGGPHIVAQIPYSTGTTQHEETFLYNIETNEWELIHRGAGLSYRWHPLGDRLYYSIPERRINRNVTVWYEYDIGTGQQQRIEELSGGVWSPDGRYRISSTGERLYQVQIWDSETGLTRQYCVPETGTRRYEGGFWWSPDSQYVALRAPLPKDEEVEGVGQHVMILDPATGTMTDLTTGFGPLFMWAPDPVEGE